MPTRPLVLIALLALSVACDGREAPASRVAAGSPAPRTVWHSLGSWSDRGSRQTESFDVTTGSLRLTWQTTGEATSDAGHFRASLHSAISGRALQTIVDTTGNGSDSVRVAIEPHVAYLQIESEGLDWRVSLEEAVANPAGTATGR